MSNSTTNTSVRTCPLCGSQESVYYFTERQHDLVACQACELFFIDPYPADLDAVHNKVSTYRYEKLKVATPATHYSAAKRYYNRYYPMVEEELGNAVSVLDIGCGTGRLLELLGQKGNLLRVGIELNIERASFARKTAQCDIYQIPVEKFTRHQNREFDIITLMNVLSHIPSFDGLFDAIHSLLADHGKLILKVGECTRNVKKDAYRDWGIPDHLHFLGMNTLAFICREYGFKILRHERLPLSEELFSKDRWKSPGRSPIRNIIKQVVAATPLALPLLKKIYDLRSGQAVYSSFVVLTQNS